MGRNVSTLRLVLLAALLATGCSAKSSEHKTFRGIIMDNNLLKDKLSPLQFRVTRMDGTEPAFRNEYWDNKRQGIYVDIISGEVLFSSTDKFDSGTGWPSFTRPAERDLVIEKKDASHGMVRVEVRSKNTDSHLGHVFPDGPEPTGLRYCINSASLKFIPVDKMEREGYGSYLYLFGKEQKYELAIFAGGCFWCMEGPFEAIKGVKEVISGYTGGHLLNPTYEDIGTGKSGHLEAVKVLYDPKQISYAGLIETFWHQIDPTDNGGQFADRGPQYRSAIFYLDEKQKAVAEKAKAALNESGKFNKPVATEIKPAAIFYNAEDYHQDYYKKNAAHYNRYKVGSGRADFIKKTWEK